MFYVAFALIALGSSLGGFATLMVPIVNWFNRHRSKAVAVSQLGYSLGGLCVPLVVLSLELFGWRVTAVASGLVILLLGMPLVQVVHHRPAAKGEVPDGERQSPRAAARHGHAGGDFTPIQAMRTRAFWFLSTGHALALLTVSTVMVHMVPHLTARHGSRLRRPARARLGCPRSVDGRPACRLLWCRVVRHGGWQTVERAGICGLRFATADT